jgi:hypothetical protein
MATRKLATIARTTFHLSRAEAGALTKVNQALIDKGMFLMFGSPDRAEIHEYWPALRVPDITIDPKTKNGETSYHLDLGDVKTLSFKAGGWLGIHNKSNAKIRVTFWDDHNCTTAKVAAEELQLPTLTDGSPYKVISPGKTATILTLQPTTGRKSAEIWINVEDKETTSDWKAKRGGGNGPDMRIDHP